MPASYGEFNFRQRFHQGHDDFPKQIVMIRFGSPDRMKTGLRPGTPRGLDSNKYSARFVTKANNSGLFSEQPNVKLCGHPAPFTNDVLRVRGGVSFEVPEACSRLPEWLVLRGHWFQSGASRRTPTLRKRYVNRSGSSRQTNPFFGLDRFAGSRSRP